MSNNKITLTATKPPHMRGIKQAIENGKINQSRYDRYCKIYEELKEKEERKW